MPGLRGIREHAARVADALRRESGVDVQVVDGQKGEFTVQVDGRRVAGKDDDQLPPVDSVVAAVRSAGQTATAKV